MSISSPPPSPVFIEGGGAAELAEQSQSTFAAATHVSPAKKGNAYHGSHIGLEIGLDEARLVRVDFNNPSNSPSWKSVHRFPLRKVDEESLTPEDISRTIDEIASQLPRCVDGAVYPTSLSLPIAWTHYQTCTGSEIEELQRKCDQMFAASAFHSHAHLVHWPVARIRHGMPAPDDQFVVAAVSERLVCDLADQVGKIGYRVRSVVPQGVALVHGALALTRVNSQAVVWLGREEALVSVGHRSEVGLNRLLPSVPSKLLKLESQEQGLDCHVLRPYLLDVSRELTATLRYAARTTTTRMSQKPILLAGPLAEIDGVAEAIATATDIPIAIWKFAGRSRPAVASRFSRGESDHRQRTDVRYATALSLALASARSGRKGYCE